MRTPLQESAQSLTLCTLPLYGRDSPMIRESTPQMIRDAAAAGFSSATVCVTHGAFGEPSDADVDAFFAALEGAPLPIVTSDVLRLDTSVRAADRDTFAARRRAFTLAARTGASGVNTTVMSAMPSIEDAGAALARLCDTAADYGLVINLEPLPFSPIYNVAVAAQVIEASDRDNVGITLDIWHWFRAPGGPVPAALRAFPPDRIHILQLDDAPREVPDDLINETLGARRLAGHGDADIHEVLTILDEIGAAPMVHCEVFDDDLVAMGPAENARRQYESTRAVLDQHWS
jgi:sugar phosphate isomerase/epimerase